MPFFGLNAVDNNAQNMNLSIDDCILYLRFVKYNYQINFLSKLLFLVTTLSYG